MARLLLLLLLIAPLQIRATHYITYLVYSEEEYIQGPWEHFQLMDKNLNFLMPTAYSESMGSIPEDFVNRVMDRLKANKPNLYGWNYEVKVTGDSVLFSLPGHNRISATCRNEMVASLVVNGYSPIIFDEGELIEVRTFETLTVPLLDLVTPGKEEQAVSSVKPVPSVEPASPSPEEVNEADTGDLAESLAKEEEAEKTSLNHEETEKADSGSVWILLFAISLMLNLGMVRWALGKRST